MTLLLSVDNVFLRAFHNVVKHTGARDSNSDGEIAGHPSDERSSYRKLSGIRVNRSVEYLSAATTAMDLKIWLVTATEAMHLHYYVFKYAKLRGREGGFQEARHARPAFYPVANRVGGEQLRSRSSYEGISNLGL